MAHPAVSHRAFRLSGLLWLLVVLLVFTPWSSPRAQPGPLLVAAAANLINVFNEVGKAFEGQTGIAVSFSFGASGSLARQIENGAPFDVFASADVESVTDLAEAGLIEPDSQAVYARGRLVAWWPREAGLNLATFDDLLDPQVGRVAIANPTIAPFGRAARQALEALGLWDALQPKLVIAQDVAAAKQVAASGNAEVAFVSISLVEPGRDRFLLVRQRLHDPIDQALGVLRGATQPEAARRFAAFLLTGPGRELLQEFFYLAPPQP